MTAKLLVALRFGIASSVTTVINTFVPGPWASVGLQVMMPLVSMLAPLGGFIRRYVSLLAGRLASVAEFVTVSRLSSLTLWSSINGSTGAEFTSWTKTLK